MRRNARLLLAALLAAFALSSWAQPIAAFAWADLDGRGIGAVIVDDSSAYVSIAGGTCEVNVLGGDTCAFTITNKGNFAVTFTVEKQQDDRSKVSSYSLTGTSSVASGPVTSASISPGGSTTLTAVTADCSCDGQARYAYWLVSATSAGTLDASRDSYPMTLNYRVSA